MDDGPSEERTFDPDTVHEVVRGAIDSALKDINYHSSKVTGWTSGVLDETIKRLKEMDKPYKYVASCIILQKNGAGLSTAAAAYWDNNTDGSVTVRWENKTMYVIVTVFGTAI